MRRLTVMLLVTLVAALATGCGGRDKIVVQDAWARPSPMAAGNGAVYMVIKNRSGEDDALIGVSSDIAEAAELHRTIQLAEDMVGAQPVPSIEVAARRKAVLKPGDYHILLIGLQEDLEPGQIVTLTLTFEKAGEMQVEAEVRAE
jgi:copper(I)-binding protein